MSARMTKEDRIRKLEAEIERIRNGGAVEDKTVVYDSKYFCIRKFGSNLYKVCVYHKAVLRSEHPEWRYSNGRYAIEIGDPDEFRRNVDEMLTRLAELTNC